MLQLTSEQTPAPFSFSLIAQHIFYVSICTKISQKHKRCAERMPYNYAEKLSEQIKKQTDLRGYDSLDLMG